MIRIISIMFLATAYAASTVAFAHSDHHHAPKKPVTAAVAKTKAKESLVKLIKLKKVDASWEKADLLSVEKTAFGQKTEWVAIFINKSVKEDAKKKLYIFMKLSGEFLAANFTGK